MQSFIKYVIPMFSILLIATNAFPGLEIETGSPNALPAAKTKTDSPLTIQTTGVGIPVSLDAPVDVQKQEAFVAAIVFAARNIREYIYGATVNAITTFKEDKRVKDMILTSSKGTIAGFELESQTMVDAIKVDVLEDMINCTFKGQRMALKLGKLIFPPVDSLKFPSWHNPPDTLSDVALDKVDWEWDRSKNYWECVVTLSYLYDPSKIKKVTTSGAKAISFEYQKDDIGNNIFEDVDTEGSAFGGGDDTPDTIRQKALDQALRNAVEQVNGIFIQALTEVKDAVLTKDDIMSQTLGVAKVLDRKFTPRFTSEGNYEIVCAVKAKVPIMLLITK